VPLLWSFTIQIKNAYANDVALLWSFVPLSFSVLRSVFASQGYVVAFSNRNVENSDAAAVCDAIAMKKVPDDDDQKKT
jgi:hypothetical protein